MGRGGFGWGGGHGQPRGIEKAENWRAGGRGGGVERNNALDGGRRDSAGEGGRCGDVTGAVRQVWRGGEVWIGGEWGNHPNHSWQD